MINDSRWAITPPSIELEGALYHVTSRGDRREPIYGDDVDREAEVVPQAPVGQFTRPVA